MLLTTALIALLYAPFSLPLLIGMSLTTAPVTGTTVDPFLDIIKGGADATGGVDATGIVNADITVLNAGSGGIVYAGPGTFSISTIFAKANVYICGTGRSTTLLSNGAGDMVNLSAASAAFVEIGHLRLNGNSTAAYGVNFTNTAPLSSGFSTARHKIHDVLIDHCQQDGVRLADTGDASGGGSEISHGQIYFCNGNGVTLSVADSLVDNCDIGQSGIRGLRDISGSNKVTGTKCWLSGRLDAANGDGFWFKSATAASACTAQDNQAHGFNFFGANAFSGAALVADSNGRGAINTFGYNFGNNATNCSVQGTAYDRQGTPTQTYPVGGLATSTKCVVIIAAGAHLTGVIGGNDLAGDNILILTKVGAPGVSKVGQSPAPLTGQVAAVASVVTATSPNDGAKHTYRVSGFVCITTLGTGNVNLEVTYTDTNGGARTCIIPLCAEAGTFATSATTADDYKGSVEISVNPNTVITVLTAGVFTGGCTYNVGATLVPLR